MLSLAKKLDPRLQGSSAYKRELHAMVEAIQKWRQYLLGQFFIVRTDHKSLKEILKQVVQTPDQQFYVHKLMGYNFEVHYKPGSSNKVADALSRIGDEQQPYNDQVHLQVLSRPIPYLVAQLQNDNKELPDLQEFHRRFSIGTLPPYYSIHNGILLYKGRYFIGENSSLK